MQPQIVVVAFHRPHYLHAVLQSLQRQGAIDRTHVWIDGCSGRPQYSRVAEGCRYVAEYAGVASITALRTNVGINKVMLDALWTHCQNSAALIVMEDDSFPTKSAIAEFERGLEAIREREDIFSVYGHHFLVEGEDQPFPRFQGWGFAAWTHKLLPVLEMARHLYALPEPTFLGWVRENMTADVRRRLEVTPGRNAAYVIEHQYSWDACLAMLTAMRGLLHIRTSRRVIYNCGLNSGHFSDHERYLQVPFNMVPFDLVWEHFEEREPSAPVRL